MKIAWVTFPLDKPGGVLTSGPNMMKGLRKLGHTVNTYFVTLNTTRLPVKNAFGYDNIVGFERPEWFEHFQSQMNSHDLVIWSVMCPHLLKSYRKTTWTKCFNLKVPQMGWIRDNYFEKYYPWLNDIPEKHDIKIVCPATYMYESIKSLRAMKRIIPHAFETEDAGLHNDKKEDLVVDHNNWKSIKHKELLVQHAGRTKAEIIMYGEDTFEKKMAMKMAGWHRITDKGWEGDKSVINADLKRAKVITNLCRRAKVSTNHDNVHMEICAYGAIPVLQMKMDPIYKDTFCRYADKKWLSAVINDTIKNFDSYESERKQNLAILDRVKPEIIAQKIIDYSNEPFELTVDKRGTVYC